MIVSRAVTDNLSKASWIRRMFEESLAKNGVTSRMDEVVAA